MISCRRVDQAALEAAHRMLQPLYLRRLKADVEKSLPPRVRNSKLETRPQ
jgi:SNF2 family DNA or RNA helicase